MSDFYKKLLLKQFTEKLASNDKKLKLTLEEITKILKEVKVVLMLENSALARINPPVVMVGDLHGQFYDLLRMFNAFSISGDNAMNGALAQKYIFLGDYVDRGKRSMECVNLLFTLKILYPKKFALLRGNHECKSINRCYGFRDEVLERFGKTEAEALYRSYNEVFSWLPLAGIVGRKILCMHGGISPFLQSIDDITNIKVPIEEPMAQGIAMDLLWADPMVDLKGFVPNEARGVSNYFGEDAVLECCKKLHVDLIVRAHQVQINGFGFFCGRRLLTIFSAPRYFPEKQNRGAVLVVGQKGELYVKILTPADETTNGEDAFRSDAAKSFYDDTSYQWAEKPASIRKKAKDEKKKEEEQKKT